MKWAFLIPPNLVDETFIGSDKSATVLNRQSQVEAIVSRMVQLNRQPCCGLHERPRRDQLNLRALKQASRDKRLVVAEFLPLDLLPQDVGAFSDHQVGSHQSRLLSQCQRQVRAVLLDYPFDGDTGVDDQGVQRSVRPSR